MVFRTTTLAFIVAFTAPIAAQAQRIKIDGQRFLAQTASGDSLRLDANACFFDGKGLRCKENEPTSPPSGGELNGGKIFGTISGLSSGNQVSWFVHILQGGPCSVAIEATSSTVSQRDLYLLLDDQRIALQSKSVQLQLPRKGFYRIRVIHEDDTPCDIDGLILSGSNIRGASLLRTRWRPAAAHAKFRSSTLPSGSLVWVMEMDAAPGEASFYSPMTTPFGYFGPSWTTAGKPTGLNFSMWSYGRGKPEPPIEQLSHLLAVGHPQMRFDGFGHEGTGVKPRGWTPFSNWQGDGCVLALRMDPGDPYDTYSGYVFDEQSLTWKLYAAGRKYSAAKNQRPRRKQAINVGSFVEVPGPPHRQRSGHIVREMRYRGFLLDTKRDPHHLNRISGSRKIPVGNQGRGVTNDGRFRLWMGGMEQFDESLPQEINQDCDLSKLEWMKPEKLIALFSWPTEVQLDSVKLENNLLRATCNVEGIGQVTQARIFYGDRDAITFPQRWAHEQLLPGLKSGEQVAEIAIPKRHADNVRFARMLVENEQGKFWSSTTVTVTRSPAASEIK